MSINISVNIGKAQFLESYMTGSIYEAIQSAASRIQNELTNLTPAQTGKLRSTFRAVPTPTGIQLKWGTDYASYVDAGAPPHLILPQGAKALKFNVGGETVFSKRVSHPGQKPQNFATLIAQVAMEILKEEISRALTMNMEMVA